MAAPTGWTWTPDHGSGTSVAEAKPHPKPARTGPKPRKPLKRTGFKARPTSLDAQRRSPNRKTASVVGAAIKVSASKLAIGAPKSKSASTPRPKPTSKPANKRSSKRTSKLGVTPEMRAEVFQRANGRCQAEGLHHPNCPGELPPFDWSAHHVQPRSKGGQDKLDNLIAVWCPGGLGLNGCHGRCHGSPTMAKALGLLRGADVNGAELR
mgnify:CR=1 FL=1